MLAHVFARSNLS